MAIRMFCCSCCPRYRNLSDERYEVARVSSNRIRTEDENEPLLRDTTGQSTKAYGSVEVDRRGSGTSVLGFLKTFGNGNSSSSTKHNLKESNINKTSKNRKGENKLLERKTPNNENYEKKTEISDEEDEQAILAKIVEETLAKMINVSESFQKISGMEARERSLFYANCVDKLSPMLLKSFLDRNTNDFQELSNAATIKPLVMRNPSFISQEDIDLMEWAHQDFPEIINSILVHSDHAIVEPFYVWTKDLIPQRSDSY